MKRITAMLLALAAALGAGPSAAQDGDWPRQPVTMIVPFPPGGPTDLVARVLAKQLSEQLGQQFVVENRGGANGNIGMQAAAQAKPDGYTVLYNTSSIALSPNLYRDLAFDPAKDFAAVSSTAVVPLVLLVHPSLPVKDVAEFIAYAKERPGKLSYASSSQGNITHLGAFLFNQSTGIEAAHIPYRGSSPALTDLVGGQVQFMTNTLNDSLPFIRDKRVRALAVTSAKRSDLVADVPTVAETVVPGFDMGAWQGVVVPAGTPEAVIERLNAEIRKALEADAVRMQLAQQGAQLLGSTPAEYQAYIASETKRFGEVIKAAGVQLN